MVREVKFSWDVEDRRVAEPFGRDSIFNDDPIAPGPPQEPRPKRRKPTRSAGGPKSPDRKPTERRHLAGADWLSPPRRRKQERRR